MTKPEINPADQAVLNALSSAADRAFEEMHDAIAHGNKQGYSCAYEKHAVAEAAYEAELNRLGIRE